MTTKSFIKIIIITSLSLLIGVKSFGQFYFSEIQGTITDEIGRPIPNTQIKLYFDDKIETTQTDSNGFYYSKLYISRPLEPDLYLEDKNPLEYLGIKASAKDHSAYSVFSLVIFKNKKQIWNIPLRNEPDGPKTEANITICGFDFDYGLVDEANPNRQIITKEELIKMPR